MKRSISLKAREADLVFSRLWLAEIEISFQQSQFSECNSQTWPIRSSSKPVSRCSIDYTPRVNICNKRGKRTALHCGWRHGKSSTQREDRSQTPRLGLLSSNNPINQPRIDHVSEAFAQFQASLYKLYEHSTNKIDV